MHWICIINTVKIMPTVKVTFYVLQSGLLVRRFMKMFQKARK